MTTAEQLVEATASAVNTLGAKFYFDGATLAAGKEIGLDGMRFYVLGRGGVLGDVEPAIVTGAFGYFHHDLVARMWTTAAEIVAPRDAARAYLECNAELGRAPLADVDLAAFCDAAEQVCADVHPAGLSLYAGVAAEPLPADLAGRAMQLLVTHRELRGSQHLVAIVASQLHPTVAHALRRPNDLKNFGWPEDLEIPADAPAKLDEANRLTNVLNADAYRSLSADQRTAFVAGVHAIEQAFATA